MLLSWDIKILDLFVLPLGIDLSAVIKVYHEHFRNEWKSHDFVKDIESYHLLVSNIYVYS
jgi:hypothetical protein